MIPTREDRMCQAKALDNVFRRRFGPPSRLVDLLDVREGMTVADLGAGVGYYAPEVLRRIGTKGRLYLVDIDEENLAIARRRCGNDPRLTVMTGTAAKVPGIPDSSVDRCLLSLVLCCLADKSGAIGETWRVLKPGGVAVATFPYRARRPPAKSRRLGLTREMFQELASGRPWTVEQLPGRLVRRYRLRKPPTAAGSP